MVNMNKDPGPLADEFTDSFQFFRWQWPGLTRQVPGPPCKVAPRRSAAGSHNLTEPQTIGFNLEIRRSLTVQRQQEALDHHGPGSGRVENVGENPPQRNHGPAR